MSEVNPSAYPPIHADPKSVIKTVQVAQKPSLGRLVHYRLSAADAEKVNRRRTDGESIRSRLQASTWPPGAQAHIGNSVIAGDVVPMMIVRVMDFWPQSVINGQAFLDGNDVLWVTSVREGDRPGEWCWPPRT